MKYKAKKVLEKEAKNDVNDCTDKINDKLNDKNNKNWYRAPTINSPEVSNFKKFAAVTFIVIAVVAMVLLALQKINWIEFWLTTIFCAVFAWFVLPKMK